MANKSLELVVKLKALEGLSAPLRKATAALKGTQDNLKTLQKTQKQIASYKTQQQALTNTSQKLNDAREKVKQLAAQMKSGTPVTQKLKNEFTKANQSVHALSQGVKKQRLAMSPHIKALKDAGISTRNLSQHEATLKTKIDSTTAALNKQQQQLKKVASQEARRSKLREQHGKDMQRIAMVGAAGYTAMASGKRMIGAGANIIAPGMDFDKEMSNVQALARLNKNDPAMQALRNQAQQLGANTAFTAGDAARGQAFLAMAGFTPKAIQEAMPGLLNMALAGDLDLGFAADVASNIAGAFKLPASQMNDVADILSKASTTSNTSISQLAETMKYVGPVAREAGMGLAETAAMAGLLGNVGIQGSEGGTVLRAMLLRLAAPTGPAAKALDKLGVKVREANGDIRNMPELLKDVAAATKGMGGGERLEYLKTIFGERPAAGLSELIGQAGAAGLDEYIAVVKDYQGTAEKMAATKMDNLVGDLKSLESAWQNIGIVINDDVGPALRDSTQGITGLLRTTGQWMKDNKETTATIIKVVTAIVALITVAGTLMIAFSAIAGPLKIVIFLIKLMGVTTAISFAPIYLAVLLLAVAALLIYKNWGQISEFFGNLWEGIKTATVAGWDYIKGKLTDGFEWLFNKIDSVKAFFAGLPEQFSTFGANLVAGFIGGIKAMAGNIKDTITGLGGSTVGWFKDKLGINSPSRVFAELGVNTLQGYNQGLDKEQGNTIGYLADLSKKVTATAAGITFAGAVAATPIMASGGGTSIGGDTVQITIQAGSNANAQDIAQEVDRILKQRDRQKAVRHNSRLGD